MSSGTPGVMGILGVILGTQPLSPSTAHRYNKWFIRSYAIAGLIGWSVAAYYIVFTETNFTWREAIFGDRDQMIIKHGGPACKVYFPGEGWRTIYRADLVKEYEDKRIEEIKKVSI